MCMLLAHNMLSSFWISGAPRAKARGPSRCFNGPAFAEAASRRQAEPIEGISYCAPSELRRVPSPHSSTV